MESQSQRDLFGDELPHAANPHSNFERFHLPGGKIVEVPFSVWKDGRKRFNLTDLGGGIITSRNAASAYQQAEDELRGIFRERDEAVRQADQRAIEVVRKFQQAREQKIVRTRSRNKLARQPRSRKGELRFINPKPLIGKDSDWCFGPRFVWLNNVPEITGAEQDCYSWMVFRASDDGIFRGSLRQLANDVRCSREHLQRNVIHSLLDRLLIERIDRGRGRAAWFRFVDPEQLGWRTKITTPPGELPSPLLANLMPRPGEETSPHKERVKEQPERTINRATRAQDERDLLEQIRRIVGNLEMSENGGAWRMRIRHCRKAVQFAIEDWKMRTPASPSIKVSPAAWLMDRHARALVEIDKAKAHSA